jgi:UDP-N-acetylglucosamine--N-acetylmuramyl-(pentapeptide) pyrophosphoryl-undecaprenol N-acetylglucosamine transferase
MVESHVPHILFAGGGSGGHLFPGLAVAAHIAGQFPDAYVSFAGPGKRYERDLVTSAGYDYITIPSRGLPRRPWHVPRFLSDNLAGYFSARWMLKELHVSLVVGLGGYASAATVRAASARGIPVILLEQNAIPGRATRWLAPRASLVCGTFEAMNSYLHVRTPVHITGCPVRPEFVRLWNMRGPTAAPDDGVTRKRLLILGGSHGARALNLHVPAAINRLQHELRGWEIIHQTGPGGVPAVQESYETCPHDTFVVSFIDDMAATLANVDLVISRAGGSTLAELAMARKPTVLIPCPQSADDHQAANARVLAAGEACCVVDQREAGNRLADVITREVSLLVNDEARRAQLANRIGSFARPAAAEHVVATVQQLIYGHRRRKAA